MVTIANHPVLYTWKLLRVNCKHSQDTHKRLTMWSHGCGNYLDVGNLSTMYMFIKLSCCTLQTHIITFVSYSSIKFKEKRNKWPYMTVRSQIGKKPGWSLKKSQMDREGATSLFSNPKKLHSFLRTS